MRPLRLAITTLGCKVNRHDGDALLARLQGIAVEVPFSAPADLYIVNSCTVTAVADRQSRQLVYRARRRNPAARVVLTGCLPAVDPERARRVAGVDEVFPLAAHARLVEYVEELTAATPSGSGPGAGAGAGAGSAAVPHRARTFLKLQDGCDHACSYCIVPRARGASRSCLDPARVRAALRDLSRAGFEEVVLSGIHLGQYGKDLDPPTCLVDLLRSCRELAGAPGQQQRLRLSSIEPLEVTPGLVDLLAGAEDQDQAWICPHLHLPIQSGADRVLEAMNRPYRSAEVLRLLVTLRERLPHAALGTDLIVGFPGERDEDFAATLALLERSPLTHLHVFPYSPRPDTPAQAAWQRAAVPAEIVRDRAARLRRAGRSRLRSFAWSQLGGRRTVLLEGRDREGLLRGVSDNYLRVTLREGQAPVGRLVEVELLELCDPGDDEAVRVAGRIAGRVTGPG